LRDRSLQGAKAENGARSEAGSILVIFALLFPMFLMVCAVVIDVGYWWVAGKKAQIAADACALAAAHELPQTWDRKECMFEGEDYVLVNLPYQDPVDPEPKHLGTWVISPYNSNGNMVEATVQIEVQTFFGRILGLHTIKLQRRAVAEKLVGTSKMAIFTGSTDCSAALRIDGDSINVTGHVHSNGEYTVNGAAPPEQVTFTSGTIAKENCVADVNPDGPPASNAGATYGEGGEWLPQDGEELQWPDWFYPGDYGWYSPEGSGPTQCTYKAEHIQIDDTHLKISGRPDQLLAAHPTKSGWDIIPTATYCATGSFKISGNFHEGQITALSPIIQVDGKGQAFTPRADEMLFFTVPNSNTDSSDDDQFTLGNFNPANKPPYEPCMPSPAAPTELNGEQYTWAGIIFNPCGRVKINNKSSSIGTPQLVGTIYGFEVEVNGDDFNMVGTQDTADNINTALVE
jgi:Putative Flp pilus-assembly TadE/G-like